MPLGKVLWEKVDVLDDDIYLFALNGKFRHLLLAMVERLTWRAAYQGNTVDADWDTIQALVEEGTNGLMSSTKVQELIDAQEATTAAIYATACCLPGGEAVTSTSGDLVIDPVGLESDDPPLDTTDDTTWPPDLETDPTGATDFADLAALSSYLCRSAEAMFDLLLDMLTIAGWYHELAYSIWPLVTEWISSAIVRLYPTAEGAVVAFSYEQVAALLLPWAEELDKALIDNAKDEIELMRDAIVCAIANADSYSEAIADVQAVLLSGLTSAIMYTWLTSGGVIGLVVALVFRAWADPEDYECSCVPQDELLGWVIDNYLSVASDPAITVTPISNRLVRFQATSAPASSKFIRMGAHLISALCPAASANVPQGSITYNLHIYGTINTTIDDIVPSMAWTWGNNCEDNPSTNPGNINGTSFQTPGNVVDLYTSLTWAYPSNVDTAHVQAGLASVHATAFDIYVELLTIEVEYL
jgi:hypothetical protein